MLALLNARALSEASTCEPESIAAATDKCNFTAQNCVDDFSGIACSYVELEFCSLGGSGAALGALSAALLLVLISGLGSTADVFFIPQLNYLSALLRLSPDVAGITLLALGNGAPDVFTAIAVAHSADFPLLLSDLLGGSVFIATVVLGAVTLTAHKYQQRRTAGNLVAAVDDGRPAWTIEPLAFWRDMGVYLFAIVAALAVAADGQIWLAESLLFLGIYLGYIALVLLLPRLRTMFPALFGGRRVAVASGNVNGSALLPAAGIGGDPGLVVPPYSDRAFLSDPALSKPNGLSDAEAATATMLAAADDDDDEAEPMAGLDYEAPEGGGKALSVLYIFLYFVELPLSIIRYLSIPAADCQWDDRRRRWTCATPPFAALLFLLEASGGGWRDAAAATAFGADWTAGDGAPLWAILAGAGLVTSALLWLTTVPERPPRWYPLLVLAGFCTTIVWLDLLANEVVAIIESFGLVSGISTSILGLTVIAVGNSIGDFVADTAAAKGSDVRMAVAACFGSPLLMNVLGIGVSLTIYTAVNGHAIVSPIPAQCRVGYFFLFLALLSSVVAFPLHDYCLPRWYAYYLFTLYFAFIVISCLVEAFPSWQSALCSFGGPCV